MQEQLITQTLPVTGMSCAACAVSIQSMIAAQPGVALAEVNYATGEVKVTYRPGQIQPEALQKAVQSIGYDLVLDKEDGKDIREQAVQQHYRTLKTRVIAAGLLTLPVVVTGMFFMNGRYANAVMLVLTTPVLFVFGRSFFISAFKQARHGIAGMDTLVALSTGIAWLFSVFNTFYPEFWHTRGVHPHVYFEAAAVVIVFIMLGKLLEERAKAGTSTAIKKLVGLQPKTVLVITDQGERETLIADVHIGDRILVRSGEKIPVDGEILEGSSYVNESMISGESVAVPKGPGDKVLAGTINQKGSFRFRAEKVGSETMLAQIIQMVREAQGSRAPVQKLVDKIAGIFVPVVILVSILTLLTWLAAGGEHAFTQGLLAMVTVLVIACPCALGLATPTAIMVGIGLGAEMGILIRDAGSLESGHRVNAVILDKTGTITQGRPEVTELIWSPEVRENKAEMLRVLLALELQSEHPLAEAIVACLRKEVTGSVEISGFRSLTGKGVTGQYNGSKFIAGSLDLIREENGILGEEMAVKIDLLQRQAKTVICFANASGILAIAAIADQVKDSSRQAISDLRAGGIDVYMLTGDNRQTAAAVASAVGITDYQAGVLPSAKADFVKKLQGEGKVVAMIGDGINDSQALAQADVSIAMGKGSDIAIDVAKITLMSSDLRHVPKALHLSKLTVRTIRQNLFWAFIYNLAGIPIAAGILYPFYGFLLNPMIAGAAMALSSVSVVSNSLRLKWARL